MANRFEFFRWRFHFRAQDAVRFPAGKAANAIRGGLGLALREGTAGWFEAMFQPRGEPGRTPSGLADPPRPFVIRAAHLDGIEVPKGRDFFWDVHVFQVANPPLEALREAFARVVEEGIGTGRGRAALDRIEQLDIEDRGQSADPRAAPLAVILDGDEAASHVHLRFATPTELKGEGGVAERPEFAILFGRVRDRIAALSALYGRGPLEVDFRGLGERARAIRLERCELEWRRVERRSGRTGQVHPIGGFTGVVEYAGELGEFLPWLAAARWAGVGRQTVWGKGDVRIVETSGDAGSVQPPWK